MPSREWPENGFGGLSAPLATSLGWCIGGTGLAHPGQNVGNSLAAAGCCRGLQPGLVWLRRLDFGCLSRLIMVARSPHQRHVRVCIYTGCMRRKSRSNGRSGQWKSGCRHSTGYWSKMGIVWVIGGMWAWQGGTRRSNGHAHLGGLVRDPPQAGRHGQTYIWREYCAGRLWDQGGRMLSRGWTGGFEGLQRVVC